MDTLFKLVFDKQAEVELDQINNYITFELCNETAAKKLMAAFDKDLSRLKYFPEMCVSIGRYRKMVVKNYIALYRIDKMKKEVIVEKIIYGKRDYLKLIEN